MDRVAGDRGHILIVPNIGVHQKQILITGALLGRYFEETGRVGDRLSILTVLERTIFLVLFLVPPVDVDADDHSAGSELGRPVVEEFGVVQLELADLVAHITDDFVRVEAE